jgi:hypothetical protein
MGLKDILLRHNVPLPDDFDKRLDIVIAGLKNKLSFKKKLRDYAKQNGGFDLKTPKMPGMPAMPSMPSMPSMPKPEEPEDPNAPKPPPIVRDQEDYLGPRLRWFLTAVTSPYGRTILQGVFMVVFFLSYLEKIPVFGSILSSGLDVILAGGKVLTKTIQNALPTMIGLVPLPYMSIVGLAVASIFGFIVWPIVAMVSFSRQDFVSSIESFIRVIPPPIGDIIANNFLEANRTVARLDEKRIKLGNDIATVFQQISAIAENVSTQMKDGLNQLAEKTKEAAGSGLEKIQELRAAVPATPTMPTMPAMPALPLAAAAAAPVVAEALPTPAVEPVAPAAPLPEPVAPVEPVAPAAPLPEPVAPAAPVVPATPAAPAAGQQAGRTRKAKRRLHRRTPKNKKWSRKRTRQTKSRTH